MTAHETYDRGGKRRLAPTMRALLGCQSGASTVEFAVSFCVQITLMLGLMESAIGIYTFHFIAEAAREGSRYARVRGSACTGAAMACPAAPSDVQAYVRSLAYPGITGSAIQVTSTWSAFPSGSGCSPSVSCNNPGNVVTVTVTYPFMFSVTPLTPNTWHFTSTSASVISQ